MQTIYILWLRQLKRYFRSKARIVGSLGQPLLFLFAFGFGFGSIYSKAGGGNYIEFLAPGIIGMSILFSAVFSGMEIIWDKQFGFLKETLIAPVSRVTIMLGRTIGGATVATVQGIIVFLLALLIGFHPFSLLMLPVAFIFMFLLALAFTAFGTAIASLLNDMQGFQLIMNFLLMPLFFLSGALFPIEGVPKVMELITNLNPVSYGMDALRGTLSGLYHFSFLMDLGVLSIGIVIFVGLGSFLFSRIQA
jgi:ABC-2 type transport system permease protein